MLQFFFKYWKRNYIFLFVILITILSGFFIWPYLFPERSENYFDLSENSKKATALLALDFNDLEVKHLKTPSSVKAIYMTSWVAGTPSLRSKLIDLIDQTEINSVVIDIKDYSGRLAFLTDEKNVSKYKAPELRINNIKDFLALLHKKNIYIIGRISAFQDSHLVHLKPEWAVKKMSDKNQIWRDKKGIAWIDVSARGMWRYLADIGHLSYKLGFDELNFDYVRFPSDGNMDDIYYPFSEGLEKKEALRQFFGFLHKEFRDTGAVLSVDLFGMTTTNTDDLNIGQYLEYALPYFDYVAPMVYPSHYPSSFIGILNPASEPYKVVRYSLDEAFRRASTTPEKIRPWLQDFDLGADYDAKMVRAQIQATYDAGFKSFMIWSPSNQYTKGALKGN